MNNTQKPEARKENLVIQEMPEEVLVYDLNTNKAHCLNKTAAFVWKACDGKNTISDITQLFKKESGIKIDEDLVWLAIDQLKENELLQEQLESKFQGESRRNVIKKIGFGAVVALPIVASLVAPTSVLAVTSCAGCTNVGANAPECIAVTPPCGTTCTAGGLCVT